MGATRIATLVLSVLTFVAAVVTVRRALRRRRLSLTSGSDPLRPHRFTRRRVSMGVLLALVAVMLFLGEFILEDHFSRHPMHMTLFYAALLGVLLWLMGLALFDLAQVWFSHYDVPPGSGTNDKPPLR
ncbi:MAG TPA: hypothetical protein VMY39_03905 [Planctomycetota bacterium]|nr:hypothetical protein [Planctomycetota bacterium]